MCHFMPLSMDGWFKHSPATVADCGLTCKVEGCWQRDVILQQVHTGGPALGHSRPDRLIAPVHLQRGRVDSTRFFYYLFCNSTFLLNYWLVDRLYMVLGPTKNMYANTIIVVKGLAKCRPVLVALKYGLWAWRGCLWCHTCCDFGPQFFPPH